MVFVSCVSLICPVGHSAASAAAALRAGIATFAETGYRDVQGEPIVGATVPALDPELRGQARLLALAAEWPTGQIRLTQDTNTITPSPPHRRGPRGPPAGG